MELGGLSHQYTPPKEWVSLGESVMSNEGISESGGASVLESERVLERAVSAFQAGRPVLIHDFDDREDETDLVYPAAAVDLDDVERLRNDAGGLVCVAIPYEVAEEFDLPFLADALSHPASEAPNLSYDERSSFSLSVNHRDTHTGITDKDRALTIGKLAEAAREPEAITFEKEFRVPGHVHVLKAAPNLLADREGHTEFGVELAVRAGRAPAAVVCEMLDDDTGAALTKADARRFARKHGMVYLTGSAIIDAIDRC